MRELTFAGIDTATLVCEKAVANYRDVRVGREARRLAEVLSIGLDEAEVVIRTILTLAVAGKAILRKCKSEVDLLQRLAWFAKNPGSAAGSDLLKEVCRIHFAQVALTRFEELSGGVARSDAAAAELLGTYEEAVSASRSVAALARLI